MTAAEPLRRRALRWGAHLTGLLLLGWFLRGVSWGELGLALRQTSGRALVGVMAMAFGSTALQGLRFWVLCPAGLSLRKHIQLSFALHAGNILLPLRAGELLRPFYLRRLRPHTSLTLVLGFSLLEKLVQALTLLPFVSVAAWLLSAQPAHAAALRQLASWLAVLTAAVLALGLAWQRYRARTQKPPAWTLTARQWLLVVLSSLGMWLCNFAVFYLVLPSGPLALALLVAVSAASALPSLPAGLGTYEAAFLWVGQLAQLPQAQLQAAALVSHLLQLLVTLAIGVPLLLHWGWPQRATLRAKPLAGASE